MAEPAGDIHCQPFIRPDSDVGPSQRLRGEDQTTPEGCTIPCPDNTALLCCHQCYIYISLPRRIQAHNLDPHNGRDNPWISVSITQIPVKNHSRPDHHMLMPRLFIHLPCRGLRPQILIRAVTGQTGQRQIHLTRRSAGPRITPDQDHRGHPPGHRQQPAPRHRPHQRTRPARSRVFPRAPEIAAGCKHRAATLPSHSKAVQA